MQLILIFETLKFHTKQSDRHSTSSSEAALAQKQNNLILRLSSALHPSKLRKKSAFMRTLTSATRFDGHRLVATTNLSVATTLDDNLAFPEKKKSFYNNKSNN